MTSLLDIGPLTEQVPVNGKLVTVYGVTPEGFFFLLAKFPALATMLDSGGTVDLTSMESVAPQSGAYAIAVATTKRTSYPTVEAWVAAIEETARVAEELVVHYQVALFEAGLRLTFPEGLGPFMRRVVNLANAINRASGQTVSATTSSKPSRTGFVTESRGMRLGPKRRSANLAH